MTGAERLRREGIILGRAEGRAEARIERDIQIAKNMRHEGMTTDLIAKIMGYHEVMESFN